MEKYGVFWLLCTLSIVSETIQGSSLTNLRLFNSKEQTIRNGNIFQRKTGFFDVKEISLMDIFSPSFWSRWFNYNESKAQSQMDLRELPGQNYEFWFPWLIPNHYHPHVLPNEPRSSGTDEEESSVIWPKCPETTCRRGKNKGCGHANRSGRIVNGSVALENEFPWMVAIFKARPGSETLKFVCGGTLINNNFVLTAAHCLHQGYRRLHRWELIIRFGDHDVTLTESDQLDLRPKRIIIHPFYLHWKRDYNNDIALIEFRIVPLSKTISPLCLPQRDEDWTGQTGTIAGWGKLIPSDASSYSDLPIVLQKLEVPVIDSKVCKDESQYESHEITDNMICAGFLQGEKDACTGDSGGSLMVPSKAGKFYAVGIVSWGQGCAKKGYPGVYTRVGKYLKWIETITIGSCFC